jgi:hypothetical protein
MIVKATIHPFADRFTHRAMGIQLVQLNMCAFLPVGR